MVGYGVAILLMLGSLVLGPAAALVIPLCILWVVAHLMGMGWLFYVVIVGCIVAVPLMIVSDRDKMKRQAAVRAANLASGKVRYRRRRM